MSLYSYFRISKPSAGKVPAERVDAEYKRLRSRTFWGVTAAYCLFYICRMVLSVVKQPVIDGKFFTPEQVGIIDSALLFVYAVGKFTNGFIADYCNICRFMAAGLFISAGINLLMGLIGLMQGWFGIPAFMLFVVFAFFWGVNGWFQSMGAPPGVISLSRWFPLKQRGTFYSIFCATPYFGKFMSMILIGHVVLWMGWQWGFMLAAAFGVLGGCIILAFVSDTPESKGLPSIQTLSGEKPSKEESIPTRTLQKAVLRNPGVWIIAISSAFVYITQYGISNWGIFFLQKDKGYALTDATFIIGLSEGIGVLGTIFAGWLSDKVFKGDRLRPVVLCGLVCLATLSLFLLTKGSYVVNIIFLSVASLSLAALYCIVAGIMALDIVPRKATGAALGVVGISSYVAAGLQGVISGVLIGGSSTDGNYNFVPVAIFWLSACLVSFVLPVLNWKIMKKKVI